MFPAVALFYDLLFYRGSFRSKLHVSRSYAVLGIYAVISLVYIFCHLRVISGVAELNAGGNYMADWRQPGFLSAVAVNLATYLWHFWTFFPLMPLDTREAWADVPWLVLLVWGALIAFYAALGRKFADKKRYHFFWGWQVLTVLPAPQNLNVRTHVSSSCHHMQWLHSFGSPNSSTFRLTRSSLPALSPRHRTASSRAVRWRCGAALSRCFSWPWLSPPPSSLRRHFFRDGKPLSCRPRRPCCC